MLEGELRLATLAQHYAEADVLANAIAILRGQPMNPMPGVRPGPIGQVNNTINNPTVRNTVAGWVDGEPENINKHNGSTD